MYVRGIVVYGLMVVISVFVRQFCLPNPFVPLGDIATLINFFASGILVPVSFVMTGLIYDKGSFPTFGSFLFLIVYILNTKVLEWIFRLYPAIWLMGFLGIVYIVAFVFMGIKLRETFD